MPWYRTHIGSLALRCAGLLLLALACAAVVGLRARAIVGRVDAIAWLLAAASFMFASGGAALVLLGRHLFDRIPIARRWSRYRD